MAQETITAGSAIFEVGEVIPTPHGNIKILSKRVYPDRVQYVVEAAGGQVLTIYQPASFTRQVRERIKNVLAGRAK